jgi:A/G-specific adenine glycosylase
MLPHRKERWITMFSDFDFKRIVEPLLDWFEENARVLPWRSEPQPYRVWVSEIMLQQTRVEAVKPYFERFMKKLPSVQALAECEEEPLLKLWEGLGYYNRVRNMQTAAQTVMAEYGGELPKDYEALLKLKGIGSYTAGAIASIAYQIPVPAVDGNVLRVITRVSGDTSDIMKQSVKTEMERILLAVIPQDRPGAFNQALMELGATVCVPNGQPLCEKCPWNTFCRARLEDRIGDIPVKTKQKARRIEDKTIFVIKQQDHVILNKRPKKGLLAGLYELPNTEGKLSEEEALAWVKAQHLKPLKIKKLEDAKHIFSHVEWHMTGYEVWIDELEEDVSGMLYVELTEARENYPIPTAFSAYTGCIFTKIDLNN